MPVVKLMFGWKKRSGLLRVSDWLISVQHEAKPIRNKAVVSVMQSRCAASVGSGYRPNSSGFPSESPSRSHGHAAPAQGVLKHN